MSSVAHSRCLLAFQAVNICKLIRTDNHLLRQADTHVCLMGDLNVCGLSVCGLLLFLVVCMNLSSAQPETRKCPFKLRHLQHSDLKMQHLLSGVHACAFMWVLVMLVHSAQFKILIVYIHTCMFVCVCEYMRAECLRAQGELVSVSPACQSSVDAYSVFMLRGGIWSAWWVVYDTLSSMFTIFKLVTDS